MAAMLLDGMSTNVWTCVSVCLGVMLVIREGEYNVRTKFFLFLFSSLSALPFSASKLTCFGAGLRKNRTSASSSRPMASLGSSRLDSLSGSGGRQ